MSDTFNDFLIDVASDPDQMDAFREDPARFLDRAPLTTEQRIAVLTGDSRRIHTAMDMAENEPPVAMISPPVAMTRKKKRKKKKKKRTPPPPVASKQRKPAKRKRASATRKTATRKTSRKSTKKK